MNSMLIIQMILTALGAVFIYTLIGFIPGTDETTVLLPVTLAVVLSGAEPIIVLTFFIAAIVTLNLTNSIPTALIGLPGGVMSSPMLEYTLFLRDKGMSELAIRKIAAGSLIGTLISIPLALILANLLVPYASKLQVLAPLLFFLGAIFLSLMGKNKLLSIVSIIPLAILFMGLRHLYWGLGIVERTTNITTSFFLAITIGPLIISLLSLLDNKHGQSMVRENMKKIRITKGSNIGKSLNPLKLLSISEIRSASIFALIANFLFVLSPVGLTILLGQAVANKIEDPVERATTAITTMSALIQSTYLSGIIIPLMALGIPLSPTAIGPGGALFNAPPVFTVDNNPHHLLSRSDFLIGIMLGAIIALGITYYITNRFAGEISSFVLQRIPHEAILALFISIVLLLAYMDAGLINIFGVLLLGIVCGTLNKMGVNYGIQFMTLYAAPWIVEKIILL